jgi:hypothetical protein
METEINNLLERRITLHEMLYVGKTFAIRDGDRSEGHTSLLIIFVMHHTFATKFISLKLYAE